MGGGGSWSLPLADGLVSNEAANAANAYLFKSPERGRERYGGEEEALIWGDAAKRRGI